MGRQDRGYSPQAVGLAPCFTAWHPGKMRAYQSSDPCSVPAPHAHDNLRGDRSLRFSTSQSRLIYVRCYFRACHNFFVGHYRPFNWCVANKQYFTSLLICYSNLRVGII